MHTNFLQLRNVKYDYDELSVSQIEDRIESPIDYVQEYRDCDMEELILTVLEVFEKHGCEIDKDKHTFKVVDVDAFYKLLLDDDYYLKRICHTGDEWTDLASAINAGMSLCFCTMPCVYDSYFYSSLFEATRYDIIDNICDGRTYEPLEVEIVGVYDCHF